MLKLRRLNATVTSLEAIDHEVGAPYVLSLSDPHLIVIMGELATYAVSIEPEVVVCTLLPPAVFRVLNKYGVLCNGFSADHYATH